jgi:DNA polymerase-3 subunit epsilon
MQLQLSLKIADRLHHDLLVRGEPLPAADAAQILLGAPVAAAISVDVLEVLVRDDRRFCWTGAAGELLTLRSWQCGDPDLCTVPFVALDLETTGAKAGAGKITEVGAVRIEGMRIVDQFQTLVNPQRAIPPMITKITGITQSMVADAPRIEEVIPGLLEFLEGAVVVAHNAPFDVGFLNYELHRLRSRRLGDGAIDTLPLSRALVPGLVNYRLKTVADSLGAPVSACHRALADAQAVAHVFIQLAGVLETRGVTSLGGMREHGRLAPSSHLDKLGLTRGLPGGPGTYMFLGAEDRPLLVGRADHLAEEVRSFFMINPRNSRGLKTAVSLVERIDHEAAATPLEALFREQRLLLEYRPPYNPFWTSPESYVYIKAGGSGPGLTLSATRREPRWLGDRDLAPASAHRDLVIGPFRRRSSAHAAVALLQRCYPIRSCSRRSDAQPCNRGTQGLCLTPCIASPEVFADHDTLVTDLVRWLSGSETSDGLDPISRAEQLARQLSRRGEREEARLAREGCEHLLNVRRAYDALATARTLDFAYLHRWTPVVGAPVVRLNLVLRGNLVACVSLDVNALEQQISGALGPLGVVLGATPATGNDALVAVRQSDLDTLLAVGRWFHEEDHAGDVIKPLTDRQPESLEKTRDDLCVASRTLLAR